MNPINYGHSVFTMDHVNAVVTMTNLEDAKAYCINILDASTANNKNKSNIRKLIEAQKNINKLANMMSNHILAHPSENLKVI